MLFIVSHPLPSHMGGGYSSPEFGLPPDGGGISARRHVSLIRSPPSADGLSRHLDGDVITPYPPPRRGGVCKDLPIGDTNEGRRSRGSRRLPKRKGARKPLAGFSAPFVRARSAPDAPGAKRTQSEDRFQRSEVRCPSSKCRPPAPHKCPFHMHYFQNLNLLQKAPAVR